MDAYTAGRLCRSVDPLHSLSYFLPEVAERFGALGMSGMTPYFAVRAAPMGAVSASVVAAVFYTFNPEFVAQSIPAAWALASPDEVIATRYEMLGAVLSRVLGEEFTRSNELVRAAAILRRTAEDAPDGDGRPLYAAHAELAWPDAPHMQLWHAVTLLREYRGDGHTAALVANGLNGLEALVSHTAAGIGFSVPFAQTLRGWSEEQWAAGVERLRSRGLLGGDGTLTEAGEQLRVRVEDLTDELGYAPWATVNDVDRGHIVAVADVVRAAVGAAGLIPAQAFGPRYGEPR
ncbi:hypothetical protein H7J88_06785 [Mycolicibacterium flavescens]|uniref:SalK n=1 Tax=Mycolicibacterium flavescens TaxID=1776 RepID=A0A1E3RQ55_MYCFV|nr:hypothetical protein [Mycolicibacterium flavescens]MCV7279349.1 hypothetical protein [Mycolicibacterium flavescens]ODQ92036.1 hypothetical protein BHQ18_04125 [Mycolicibacterium flavescens]